MIGYNNGPTIGRAVRSVLNQTLGACEVIVVDDASTDQTAAVTARLAREAPSRVTSVRLASNSGHCGRPRNVGMTHATGRYVMFLDGDDTLPRHALMTLVSAAERDNADIVSGRCMRHYVERKTSEPWMHRFYRRRAVYETFQDRPELINDTLSTNKLYRRDFLSRHGLTFTEDRHYEDSLFVISALLVARRIALVPHTVYNWFVRERADNPSITRRASELQIVADRISIHRELDGLLEKHESDAIKVMKDTRFINHDLRVHLADIAELDAKTQQDVLDIAAPYVQTLRPEAFARARPASAVAAFMVGEHDLAGVLEAMAYHPVGIRTRRLTATLARDGDRVFWCDRYLDHPLGRTALDVTGLGFADRPLNDLELDCAVTDVSRDGDRVRLHGRIVNPLGRIRAGKLRATLDFVDRRRRSRRATVKAVVTHSDTELRWSADLTPTTLRPLGLVDVVWDLRMTLKTGNEVVRLRVFADEDVCDAMRLPVRPRLTRVTGDTLVAYRTLTGDLSCRVTATRRTGRLLTGAVGAVRSSRTGTWAVGRLRSAYRSVRGRWTDERTKIKLYHHVLTRLPIRRDLVVFESNLGRRYADSPKYIYEALRRQNRRYTAVWSYAKTPAGFPSDAELVRRGSWSYYLALARAAFWVDNRGFPDGLSKRKKTTYIQTWQGSTVTPTGFDAPAVRNGTAGQRRRMQRSVDRFDKFLVRSEYDISTLVAGLRTNADLVRCGNPSNDILVNSARAGITGSRRRLGIRADGRLVLLYAPTLRRGSTGSNPALFDLHSFVERLGDRYVLLIRPDYRSKFAVPHELAHTVRTANHIHDVNDVLLLSDVLITDYSSLMFDYALLDRPMILYVPDDEDPSHGRGTHLDLASDGPGPLVRDEAELFDILDNTLTEVSEKYAERRRDFVARYGEYDTGTAADAVVDQFFVRRRRDG